MFDIFSEFEATNEMENSNLLIAVTSLVSPPPPFYHHVSGRFELSEGWRRMVLSDEELVEQMSAGDESALRELYDRHARQVLGLLIRFVPQRADAEDLLQVTFLEVWRKAKTYHPLRGRPIVWLCLIARSRALDWLRRKPAIEPSSEFSGIADKEQVASVEQRESSVRIQEAIARLPHEQSSLISLAFFDGLTHEQISAQQGVPLGTVKTRIRQGMSRLGHLLRKQGMETFT